MLKNETNSCSEIKRVEPFKNSLAFTEFRAHQVKVYNPVDKVVTIQEGSGHRGNEDWTVKSCTFVQPHGICTVGETIFVTDAATGVVKLITEQSGTTQFLKQLGLLYDSFGITCKGTASWLSRLLIRPAVAKVIKVDLLIRHIVEDQKPNF